MYKICIMCKCEELQQQVESFKKRLIKLENTKKQKEKTSSSIKKVVEEALIKAIKGGEIALKD